MFRMTSCGHRLSNGGLTDSHLPLDVPGGSLDLGCLPRDPPRGGTLTPGLNKYTHTWDEEFRVEEERYVIRFGPSPKSRSFCEDLLRSLAGIALGANLF